MNFFNKKFYVENVRKPGAGTGRRLETCLKLELFSKFLLENELSSLTKDELIGSLLLLDLLDDAVYHNHLSDLLAGLRYLNSAGRLLIADVIAEFLNYLEISFIVNFRMALGLLSSCLSQEVMMATGIRIPAIASLSLVGCGPERPAASGGSSFERIRMKL